MTSLPAAISEARRTGDDQTADWLEELERLREERNGWAGLMFDLGWAARDDWLAPAGPERERYFRRQKAKALAPAAHLSQPKENEDDG